MERLQVRAVQRAFDLLALVGAQSAPTLSELARASALPVSTVARLLATLERAGFVHRNGENRYAPGTRLVQIGVSAMRSLSVYELCEPHLRRLSEASGETANLAVRVDAANAVYLRQVVSPHSIHHASWLGRMLPLRKTAIGSAILGRAGAKGYVVRRDTLERGVTAVAAPVRGAGGGIVAGFSITGPSYRIGEKEVQRFGALVRDEARKASIALGAAR
jgi:IclR family acetate operon transcriptional repressor